MFWDNAQHFIELVHYNIELELGLKWWLKVHCPFSGPTKLENNDSTYL